jgi:hypothetical protein
MARHIDANTTDHGDDSVPPEVIELQLGTLICHYLKTRSPAIAQSVVRHIEQLCAHPSYDGEPADRCAYLRLRAHWRWLAQAR